MQPDVSIVMPCFNVEHYVEESLESARSQTLENIEIICVNDGSTDNTLDILEAAAAKDARIRVIDKPNGGYGETMNRGFDAATGRYLAILESDDFIDPPMMEDLFKVAAGNGNLDVVKSNFYFYWSTPVERNEFCELLKADECNRVLRPYDERHVFYVKPSIWSAIYRTDFVRDNGIRFNETPGASYQDASFNFQVWLNAQRVLFINRPYLHYRQDNEASSVNSPGKVYCVCDEYRKIFEVLGSYSNQDEACDLIGMVVKMKFDSYMWNYERLTSDLGLEFLSTVKREFDKHILQEEIDWSLFEEDKAKRLKSILDDPLFYHLTFRDNKDAPDKIATVKRYWNEGGIAYLRKLISLKLH